MSFVRDVEATILAQTRQAMRAMLAVPAARAPGLAKITELTLDGAAAPLRARYYEGEGASDQPLCLFFHGGGFVCCDIDTHDSICSWLAKASGGRVLSIDYRLAPEAPFPAQIEDARAACAWAFRHALTFGATSASIKLAGDSAGAYIAAAMARELNGASPGAVSQLVMLYPLVHVQDSLWAKEELRNFRFLGRVASFYIARALGAETLPSLLDIELSALPPTIVAGGDWMDPVSTDAEALARALKQAGVPVIERKYPMLTHGGLNLTAHSKTAITALNEVGALMRKGGV